MPEGGFGSIFSSQEGVLVAFEKAANLCKLLLWGLPAFDRPKAGGKSADRRLYSRAELQSRRLGAKLTRRAFRMAVLQYG